MTIEKILEENHKSKVAFDGWWNVKVNLLVHCSCGKDYHVKEKLRDKGLDVSYTRPTQCPSCKGVSYIQHTIKQIQNQHRYTYHSKIVTNQIISKAKQIISEKS